MMLNNTIALPRYDDLFSVTLKVIQEMGGSGSVDTIETRIASAIRATPEQLSVVYEKNNVPILTDRMRWTRRSLKDFGLIVEVSKEVWALTQHGASAVDVPQQELKKLILTEKRKYSGNKRRNAKWPQGHASGKAVELCGSWEQNLLSRLLTIKPDAFERLCKRVLQEYGFQQVEVTGRTGDCGIDGFGVLLVNLLSFHVLFQCKRWKGSVGSEEVRNFRGAMQGRSDKGLIITTGTFTSEAKREAIRDSARAIDLIDGTALCKLMKERQIGVTVTHRTLEDVTLDQRFFLTI